MLNNSTMQTFLRFTFKISIISLFHNFIISSKVTAFQQQQHYSTRTNNNKSQFLLLPSIPSTSSRINLSQTRQLITNLLSSNTNQNDDNTHNEDNNDDVSSLKTATTNIQTLQSQAKKAKLEAQKLEAELILEKIIQIEQKLSSSPSSSTTTSSSSSSSSSLVNDVSKDIPSLIRKLENFKINTTTTASTDADADTDGNNDSLDQLILQLQSIYNDKLTFIQQERQQKQKKQTNDEKPPNTTASSSTIETNLYKNRKLIPSTTLSANELQAATELYLSLPKPLRLSLAKSVGLEQQNEEGEKTHPSIIVLNLFEQSNALLEMSNSTGSGSSSTSLQELYLYYLKQDSKKSLNRRYDNNNLNKESTQNSTPSLIKNKSKTQKDLLSAATKLVTQTEKEEEEEKLISMVDYMLPRRVTRIEPKTFLRLEKINNDRDEVITTNSNPTTPSTSVMNQAVDGTPTLQDIQYFTNTILDKDIFQTRELPQEIPGGFILRGTIAPKLKRSTKSSTIVRKQGNEILDDTESDDVNLGDVLISSIDSKLETTPSASDWNTKFQVYYITDPTPQMLEDVDLSGEPVLFITRKDISPSNNRLILSGISLLSLFLCLVFSMATFGANEVVMHRLFETSSSTSSGLVDSTATNAIVADNDTSWFNELLTPILISLGLSQAFHEAGHWFVAKKDGFKFSPPTIFPLMSLPYLTFETTLKTPPKNYASLFNFAFWGPALGMISASVFLYVGLQLTLSMDSHALEYAPSVPVGFLRLSTLGGNIIDNVLYGGDGILLAQDPMTPVKLHPFAIGGLSSLMINALDTIPIGKTDGGRISQSLLGRSTHATLSGLLYIVLLIYTAFSGHRDIFLTYLVINGFVQKDMEIPCRNEVDSGLGLTQVGMALVLWCSAILILAPM